MKRILFLSVLVSLLFISCTSVQLREAKRKKDTYLAIVNHLEKKYPNDTLSFFKDVWDHKYYTQKYDYPNPSKVNPIQDSVLINLMDENKITSMDLIAKNKIVIEFQSTPYVQKRKILTYYFNSPNFSIEGVCLAPNLYYKKWKPVTY